MKSMQRLGGKMMKRSEDQQDTGKVIAQFKATDDMLDRLIKDFKTWRDGWDDILKLQYNSIEAFAALYNPIEPTNNPDQTHTPAVTPHETKQRCLALQKVYSDMKEDLQQEIGMITNKIMKPLEEAKGWMKSLHKTLKHRENMKLDYERYLSRAEHSRKKELKSPKEEAALAKHEGDLAQSEINYQTADDQVKQTFPPVVEAVLSLLPYLLANQVMVQTTLVGQFYTSLDGYCRQQQFPSPAPSDGEIVNVWNSQFTGLRKELEQGLQTLARGKVVHQNMTLPEQNGSTLTGLGIRNKTSNLVHRKSNQPLSKPVGMGRTDSAGPGASQSTSHQEEEMAPPKPPRPGTVGSPSSTAAPAAWPVPGIPMSGKPRMPSYSSNNATPYDQNPTNLMPTYPNDRAPPPYSPSAASTTPSRYLTPTNGVSPDPSVTGNDYFASTAGTRRASSHSLASSAASIAAAKKKPPPPVPAKRIPSQQAHFVTALYDFEGQNHGDLAFREGDRIRVVKKTDSVDDWWDGELRGKVGAFPANYVQL